MRDVSLTSKLRYSFLSDKDSERLSRLYPEMHTDFEKFCPTCHTTKQYKHSGVIVDCDCQYQLQLYKHYLNAGIGATYQRLSWDDYDGDETAKEYCEKYRDLHSGFVSKGMGFIFTGDFGLGKTMSLTLLMKDLLHLGYSCYSTTFTGMIEMFTAGWKSVEEQRFFQERVKRTQILLLDDLGKEMRTKTKLAESTFDDVLRSRVQDGRPTFLTTNMKYAEMKEGYGKAVFSLLKEVSIQHEFSGTDYRPKVSERYVDEILSGETSPIV